jgi:hypothetical protein
MTEREAVESPGSRCQARPAAARHGWREDPLCASHANTSARFRGDDIPVCGIHARTYLRWGSEAERNAVELWGWPDVDQMDDAERRHRERRDGDDRRKTVKR